MIKPRKLWSVCRDILLFCTLVYVISLWQERNLLADDGTVAIKNRHLYSLNAKASPLLEQGQRTLIYFFAPWCNVCAVSIGNLEQINDPSLRIVRVALDYKNQNEVQQFVDDNQVKGRVLLGNRNMLNEFNISGYPTYYYLDSQHNVVANAYGYSSEMGLKLRNYFNSL